jgi:glucosamine-6-phosphate deaminase
MSVLTTEVRHGQVGTLRLEAYPTTEAMGLAAAKAAADEMLLLANIHENLPVIFATGASQLATLAALTTMPGLPWSQISGYHLDEYVGLSISHPASFRGYLRKHLVEKVPIKEFFEIDATALDVQLTCTGYAAMLAAADPQLCLLGIGENGHLAFNDPGLADFNDPVGVKVAMLDLMCRTQQAAEGWFPTLGDVPHRAITVTIPTILRVPKLILSVPGMRKAAILRRTLEEPISTACPATILREHPGATVYLDAESASELDDYLTAS